MAFMTASVLTYFFDAGEVGRYDLSLRLGAFLYTLGPLWLSLVIMRFYPAYERHNELPAFHHAVAALRTWGIVLGLIVLVATWAAGPDRLFGSYRDLFLVAGVLFVGQSLFETGQAMARARGQPVLFSATAVINAVVKLPLGIAVALYLTRNISGMIWGAAAVTLVVYFALMQDRIRGGGLRLDVRQKAAVRETLAYGVPIGLTMMLNFFLANSDLYFLKYYRSDADVGAFSTTLRLVDYPIGMLLQTLMLAIFPTVSTVYETEGKEATERLVAKLTRTYLLLCLPLCALLAALAHPVMEVLTHRAEFRQAYDVVPWVAMASLTYGLSYYAGFGLHLAKRSGLLLALTLISIAVTLGGNRYGVPAYGYYACGIVRLVSNGVLVLVIAMFSNRHLRWTIPRITLVRVLGAAAMVGGTIHVIARRLPENLFTLAVLLGLGCLGYGLMLLATREVTWTELRDILRPRRSET
jgi:O-antigen/teichoic acid export membrane protein